MAALIYGLIDPRDALVHYVGASTCGLARPAQHRKNALKEGGPKARWIRQLQASGLDYVIAVLEHVAEPKSPASVPYWGSGRLRPRALAEAERWWIALGRAFAWPLTNQTDGGHGTSGLPRKPVAQETRTKISASRAQTAARPDVRAANRARALKQKPWLTRVGTNHSAGTKALIGAAQRRSWAAPGARDIKRAALKLANGTPAARAANSERTLKRFAERGHPSAGTKRSPEALARIAEAARRRWTTPEALAFMRGPDNPSKSPEARAKISVARSARVHPRPPCGTLRAYSFMTRERQAGRAHCGPCAECKRAATAYARDRRSARK